MSDPRKKDATRREPRGVPDAVGAPSTWLSLVGCVPAEPTPFHQAYVDVSRFRFRASVEMLGNGNGKRATSPRAGRARSAS